MGDWAGLWGVPDVDDVREWIDVPASELSDEQLTLILAAEIDNQTAYCEISADAITLPYALAQALYRRCSRAAAARGIPLGTLSPAMTGTPIDYGTGIQYGARFLPQLDAEVERYESPYRVTAVA